MAKAMTPSKSMTEEQFEKVLENFVADLSRHHTEFSSIAVQTVLDTKQVGRNLLKMFRAHVEAVSDMVVRTAVVRGNRTAEEVIIAMGRYTHDKAGVVNAMSQGVDGPVEVVFFKYGKDIEGGDLDAEYSLRGLTPAGVLALAAINEDDPKFADTYPNYTFFKNAKGEWCYVSFYRSINTGRYVAFSQLSGGLAGGNRWFAGMRKKDTLPPVIQSSNKST